MDDQKDVYAVFISRLLELLFIFIVGSGMIYAVQVLLEHVKWVE